MESIILPTTILTEDLVSAIRDAGSIVMTFYRQDIDIRIKSDGSPITLADKASHELLVSRLSKYSYPVVSEESEEGKFSSDYYWLIDPLDGTKDFLARNDEFAINIALMYQDKPILGLIFAPALDELYFGSKNGELWFEKSGVRVKKTKNKNHNELVMAVSRFHNHEDAEDFAKLNNIKESISIGASIKYGRMAFGGVDLYPRFVGTSEWDTAAGQAILEAAGGKIIDLSSMAPMLYGKPGRRNGKFIALSSSIRNELIF
jgi:3'(2'), 5'-bisphosphate nucleotidase